MKFARFNEKVEAVIIKLRHTLIVKGKEYSRNDDPFHNFKRGSKITGKSEIEVLDGMLLKHLISYHDMIDDIKKGKVPSKEYVDEKLGDIITYFTLQKIQIEDIIELRSSELKSPKADGDIKVINPSQPLKAQFTNTK